MAGSLRLFVLLFLLFNLTACRKELIDLGWVQLNKESIIKKRGYTWNSRKIENIDLYYQHNSSVDPEETIDDIDDALEDVLEYFNLSDIDNSVSLFLLNSHKNMKQITGTSNTIEVLVNERIILMVSGESSEDDFEMAISQYLALEQWGNTKKWLLTGFSKYVSTYEDNDDLHQEASVILRENSNLSMVGVVRKFTKMDKAISYPVVGSFIRFIAERQGIDVLKSIWKNDSLLTDEKIKEWQEEWKNEIRETRAER